ncbi:MAG: hydrogenase membrane subunit [Crenarchaeota archaeon]|nr:hydrogenase membrane subunit [Thermoproteota archaeon]
MVPELFALIGLAIVLLTIASKSHKQMNLLSVILPIVYLVLGFYTLFSVALPHYFWYDNYFFIDHLSIYEALITALVFFFASVYAKGYIKGSIKLGEMSSANLKFFYLAFNLLLIVVTFAFFSNNLAQFWILAELSTALSAVLIVMLNAPKNIGAALKYIFITSACMVFAFIGLILLYTLTEHIKVAGTLNWNQIMSVSPQLSPALLFAVFIFTFVGFAAKSGIVPFHAWLPTAYSKAPGPVSAILSGSVTTIGVYGILRMYTIVAQNEVVSKVQIFLIAFGIISMLIAALTMLRQTNLKKLIGYSSIEHMGFFLVGIGIGTQVAMFWTVFYMLAHSVTKALLFFSAGILHHQYNGVRIEQVKNAFKLQPIAAWSLIIGSAAIIGMPMFVIFLPKLSILMQATTISSILPLVLLLIFFIVSSAFGVFMIKIFSQNEEETLKTTKRYKAPIGMIAPIIILCIIVVGLGLFFPQQLTDLLNKIVSELGIR